jgi:hypothetical protein
VIFGLSTACGCDDATDIEWTAFPETTTLYSIATSAPNLPDGFDFVNRVVVVIERIDATGTWDVAVGTEGEELVLLPPGALGVDSYAGVAVLEGAAIEELTLAPADSTAYATKRGVPLVLGNSYVIRSRKTTGYFGETCSYYAKLEPLELSPEEGWVRFIYDSNPNCYDLRLSP